ncbi:MAG: hypothetical protein LWX56_10175 [Ignavibacteria bacterium]|nr:hypothetical protein [Ignavibacteria bacterium]
MKPNRTLLRYLIPAGLLAIAALIGGCSSSTLIDSPKTSSAVLLNSWKPAEFQTVEKISIASTHDNDYIYICLKTTDPGFIRQVFMRGLVTSFPTKGSGRMIGIKYPLGLSEMRRDGNTPLMDARERNRENGEPEGRPKFNMARMINNIDALYPEIDIIGPMDNSKDRISKATAESGYNLSISVRDTIDIFTYTIKLPYKSDMLGYSLPGDLKELPVTFEIPKFEMPARVDRGDGNSDSPRMGGRGQHGGGGMGSRGSMGGRGPRPEGGEQAGSMNEKFSLSLVINLHS